MRISLPIDVWDPGRGGAERYLHRLSLALCERGHDVTVLCLKARPGSMGHNGLHVELLKAPRFPRWLRELCFAREAVEAHRRSGRELLFQVRHALEADVYQPHGGSFRAARRAFSRSLPPWRRGVRPFLSALRPTVAILLWLDRQVFLRSPGVITISLSRKVEEDLRGAYPGIAFRFERVHGAVEMDAFHDRDRLECGVRLRSRFEIAEEESIALFVAHRFRPKGLLHALSALARAPGWQLIAAGRDHPRCFQRTAARMGIASRVHFAGAIDDPRAFFAGGDALLLPTYYDPCSLAVLEALSCGTPVITTRYNGAAELLEEGSSGFVVTEPSEVGAMAKALLEIKGRWKSFHEAALRSRQALGWSAHVDRMERVLLGAAGGKTSAI